MVRTPGSALRLLGGVAAAVVMAILVLAGGELFMRNVSPQSPPGMFTPDPVLGFTLTPNYHGEEVVGSHTIPLAFNSWGLRDREFGPRVPGRLRIYVLGDSFVFGHGVRLEDTFAKVLERQLRGRLGANAVEVVNGGVPRYGTLQEIGLFEATVARVDPDVVVLGVYVGNDVLDNLAFAGRHPGETARRNGSAVFNWLRVRSQLYMWLRQRRDAADGRLDTLQRSAMLTHARMPAADVERGLVMTEDAIARLAGMVRARGTRFGVVLIPAAAQVQDWEWQQVLARYDLPAAAFDAEEPNRRFAAFMAKQRIPVLDLQPLLVTQHPGDLYFAVHWKPPGHAVAAAATGEFLAASGLLEARPVP